MKMMTFTEFRKNASALFSDVENGETIRIIRHGKAIAEILPLKGEEEPSWKKPGLRLITPGNRLSQLILKERESSS